MLHACLYTICFVFCYTSWCFYTFSRTNLLTRRHSASSLFSAVLCFRKATQEIFSELDETKAKPLVFCCFVFQKSYTGNILGIGWNKSQTSYFSRTRVRVQSRDGGGLGPSHTLGRRGPGPDHATRGEPPWSTSWCRPSAYIFLSMGKT
jgi:hypothetical protein